MEDIFYILLCFKVSKLLYIILERIPVITLDILTQIFFVRYDEVQDV